MVKVKIGLSGPSIECRDYKWGDNGIVLYDATYNGSLWEQVEVEIFNISATILVFKGETVLETIEEIPW